MKRLHIIRQVTPNIRVHFSIRCASPAYALAKFNESAAMKAAIAFGRGAK